MTPRPLGATALACCAAATVAALAQAPAQLPTFRADTRLVEVSVVVHDKKGQAVTGLTRDDFTLLEDGQAHAIDFFSVESAIGAAPDAVRAAIGDGNATPAAPVFSNHLAAAAQGSVTAILFDRVNTRLEDQHPARDQIVKFLRAIRPGDRVALYSLEWNRTRILHDFTSDGAALLRAISWTPGADRPPDDPDLAAWISDTTQDMTAMMLEGRVTRTLDALQEIAGRLSGVRGRKNLIWVSSGVPWTIRDETMAIPVARAARAIDDANVAIYPVDARGLVGTGVAPAETMPEVAAMKGKVASTPQRPQRGVAQSVSNLDGFKELAASTGGRPFFNRNDIGTAIRAAIDDGRVTYVLGYYPSHGKWDGSFRRITVKVARAGLEVRHRAGYRAFPIRPPGGTKPGDEMLAQAQSPLAATGIGLTARVVPSADPPGGGREVTLSIHVDPGAISIWRDGEGWSVSLALAIAQSAPDGHVVKSVLGNVDVGIPAARYEQVMNQGFSFTRSIPLAETAEQMHVVLRDPASGTTGSLIIPLARLP
jgi:VWFA-related protein